MECSTAKAKPRQPYSMPSFPQFSPRKIYLTYPTLMLALPVIGNLDTNHIGVEKLLSQLKPHKASGPDGLPARLLKECSVQLAPVLALLFQSTINQGSIPSNWKSAFVTPIFKKGNRHEARNYRPISLTSIVCKTLEHIIFSQIINHLEANQILSDKQHGFWKKHSCESQLLLTVYDVAKGLDEKQQIDAILLDFEKAFDKVHHERLLLKLDFYGIRGNLPVDKGIPHRTPSAGSLI